MCKSSREQAVPLSRLEQYRERTGVFDLEGGGDEAVPQRDAEGLREQGSGRGNETC